MINRNSILQVTAFVLIFSSCTQSNPELCQRNIPFNDTWKFAFTESESPSSPDFDDHSWELVDVPHDWSIIDYQDDDSLRRGPFFKNQPGGADIGYLRTGTAWYRKHWVSPRHIEDQEVFINFDGVQSLSELYVNGKFVAKHVYGYTPFRAEISDYLYEHGKINLIALKTVNPGENSRWYAGGGIYRQVELSIIPQISIDERTIFIRSSIPVPEKSVTTIDFTLKNPNMLQQDIHIKGYIQTPDPKIRYVKDTLVHTGSEKQELRFTYQIPEPELWSPENPELYSYNIELSAHGKVIDKLKVNFGIRTIEYSVENGFILNGEPILLKGGCIHHDNGLIGAAAFPTAEYRKIKILKDNGFNAVRTSHNPPSKALLNACDELGMLVIDEAFDHWVKPKRINDYSNYFEKWHEKDLTAMVLRDRNHPSVIMWSFGNEVKERADPMGVEIGKKLIEIIKRCDRTRPVTQAICGFWDNPGKEWDYSADAFGILDIGGYNYQHENFISDHEKYPDRIMYGSESTPKNAATNWKYVEELPYVIGDFVWTAMDYIGESGIGHTKISDDPESTTGGLMPWPWYISWCGDIDILGNKKPQSYYRDIVWDQSNLEIFVEKPLQIGTFEISSFWGWPDEYKSWNWPGHEGEKIKVRIYSNYPAVRLSLNNEPIGEKAVDPESLVAEFEIKYQPGKLSCSGMINNEIAETKILQTTGQLDNIEIIPEEPFLVADKQNLLYVNIKATDKNGLLIPNDSTNLEIQIRGEATLLAAGNANPIAQGSLTDNVFSLFKGRGLLILRSNGKPGDIYIKCKSDDGKTWDFQTSSLLHREASL